MASANCEINFLTESNSNNYYLSNAYKMFVFSIRSEVTRKYYERRLRHFFNHISFDKENNKNIEVRCNNFCTKGKSDINWAIEQVIAFLHFQKERVTMGK